METIKGQKVAAKILAAMKEMGRVDKDGYNDFQKYAYVSEANMIEAIRDKVMAAGLVIIPSQVSCLSQPVPSGEKSQKYLTEVCTEYTIIDTDSGDSLAVKFFGQGIDSGDKGIYKATTGANKYFLMKTFMIPTGDDPEDEKPKTGSRKPTPQSATSTPAPASGAIKPATDAQLAKIKALLGEKNFDGNLKMYEKATVMLSEHEDGKNVLSLSKASEMIGALSKLK